MVLHTIEKQKLIYEEFEPDVLRLAQILYNTYIEDNYELFIEVKIKTLIKVLKIQNHKNPIQYVKYLFEELNEPLCVKNFKFFKNTYKMRFIYFCTYGFRNGSIDIELSEEYLYAIQNYMIDPYLQGMKNE